MHIDFDKLLEQTHTRTRILRDSDIANGNSKIDHFLIKSSATPHTSLLPTDANNLLDRDGHEVVPIHRLQTHYIHLYRLQWRCCIRPIQLKFQNFASAGVIFQCFSLTLIWEDACGKV